MRPLPAWRGFPPAAASPIACRPAVWSTRPGPACTRGCAGRLRLRGLPTGSAHPRDAAWGRAKHFRRTGAVVRHGRPRWHQCWQPANASRHLPDDPIRSEEHTSELQSRGHLVCRLLLEKKKKKKKKEHVMTRTTHYNGTEYA